MKNVKPVKAGWYNAFRPWTLHGAVIPVLIGGVVAYKDGSFCWWIFVLILIGGCLLQSAANLMNTYGDFMRGTDTMENVENHSRTPELVSGIIKPESIFKMGLVCLLITAMLGIVFIWYSGWNILFIGILGIAGSVSYTVGVSYKYHAMGLVGVFVLMGILMPIGTYLVLTGNYSWDPILVGLPNAFIITAVLSGNETRDYFEDKRANVGTFSGYLSYANSMRLYLFLNAVSFPILVLLMVTQVAPWECVLTFITVIDLHMVVKSSRGAPSNPGYNRLLVPVSFDLNWHFGVLLVIGYLIECIITKGLI